MKAFLPAGRICLILLMFSSVSYAQFVDLGSSSSFVAFTAAGAFSNDGASVLTGDIGTDVGAFTGFPPGVVIGNIHIADPLTATAAVDVDLAYNYLVGITCGQVIGTTLGNGQILLPDVYCLGAASVLQGDLYLDAQGDPTSIFVFQIDGALSTNTFTNVILVNGANICNVYWQINGAFALGDESTFRGTIVGNGAISLFEGSSLEGRALTRQGAIDLHNVQMVISMPPMVDDITADGAVSFCEGDSVTLSGNVDGTWSTGEQSSSIVVSESGIYYVFNTNGCGSDTSNSIVVDVVPDDTPPMISCPPSITVSCDDSTDPAETGMATTSDNCDPAPVIGYTDIVSQGACSQSFTITRTFTSTDLAGNISTCSQTITSQDNTSPTIICPVVTTTIQCGTDPFFGSASATDACDAEVTITFETTITPGLCPGEYSTTRTWTATDDCGNTSTCAVTIVVEDDVAPVIICPLVISPIQCGITPIFGIASATDLCDPSITLTFVTDSVPGLCAEAYSLIRTWTATDDCGNSSTCSAIITVVDNTAPGIICPSVTSPIQCGAIPSFGVATATDGCGGEVTITFTTDSVAGSCPQLYLVTRIWTATDLCGNASTCSASISIEDNEAPVIICPVAVSPVECGSTTLFGDAIATDNCDLNVAITFADIIVPGPCAQFYSLTRTWTAMDDCGNTATCSLTIDVQDNVAPIIVCPVVETTIQCGADPFFGSASATDACDAEVAITFETTSTPGLCLGEYSTTRTWTAIDDCGNTSTCAVTIIVEDNLPPVIICPVVISPVQCGSTPVFGVATATDLCDGDVELTFITETVPGLCAQEFSFIRTWTAIDDCGNTATCSATILIEDNTPPLITCPTVVSPIQCGTIPFFGTATAIDGCDTNVEVTFDTDSVSGTCPQLFIVTRIWIATDDCGNTASCSATIVIQDNTAPIIVCPVVLSPLECGSVPEWGIATATDLCDASVLISFVTTTVPGECGEAYSSIRTWTATDDCGNTATCSATIVVEGSAGLTIVCPPNQTVQCVEDVSPVNVNLVVVSGNCGDVTLTHTGDVITNQTCLNDFTLTRSFLATDDCGNTASCSQLILVSDQLPPDIELVNPLLGPNGSTLYVQCYGQDPTWDIPAFNVESVNATDNCSSDVEVTFIQELEDQGNCELDGFINLYRLTWTAADVCGNSSTAYVFLALVDTIPPVIEDVPEDLTVSCNAIPEPPSVFATDECLCACVVLFEQTEIVSQECQDGIVIMRTWTAKDRCGNETIATQRITLSDEEGPELIIVQPQIVGVADGTIIEYTCADGGIPGFYNQLDATSVFSPVSCGNAANVSFEHHKFVANNCEFWGYVEQRIYQWIAIDACGHQNSLTIIVRLIDNEAPVFIGIPESTCIGDPALQDIYAIDNCDEVSVRFNDAQIPNPCGPGMAVSRTYEAFDDCGNMTTATTILYTDENNNPVIVFNHPDLLAHSVSEIMRVECAYNGTRYTAFSAADVSMSGACSEGVNIDFTETLISTGDCLAGGVIAVLELKWTATDICGNETEISIIANLVDETSPVFIQFKPVISIGCHDTIPAVSATDNCGEVIISFTELIIPGTCQYEYDIQRQVTAIDACGNINTRQQMIHVGNGSGPVITGIIPEVCDDLSIPVVTAYDACAEQFVDVTMHQDTLDLSCRDGLVIQRIWTAVDACGHETVLYQTIILNDLEPPVIYIPTYSIIHKYLDQNQNIVYHSQEEIMRKLDALDAYSVSVYDDCDQWILAAFTVDTLFAIDCQAAGYVQRRVYTWTAEDICGHSAILTFTIDVMDDLAPVILNTNADTTIICAPLPVAHDIVLMDTSEAVTIKYFEEMVPGSMEGEYFIFRTWIVWDSCHNTTTHVEKIIWIPESNIECTIEAQEILECNSHGVVLSSTLTGGYGPYTYEWTVVGEKCFIQGGQGTPQISIYVGWSEVKVVLVVTDTFGCVSMCMTTLYCTTSAGLMNIESDALIPHETHAERMATPNSRFTADSEADIIQFELWPNPAREILNLSFISTITENVQYSLTDYLGNVVLERRFEATNGLNHEEVSIGHLPEGIYLARLDSRRNHLSEVIVILRN